jgi:hypothetical protein
MVAFAYLEPEAEAVPLVILVLIISNSRIRPDSSPEYAEPMGGEYTCGYGGWYAVPYFRSDYVTSTGWYIELSREVLPRGFPPQLPL